MSFKRNSIKLAAAFLVAAPLLAAGGCAPTCKTVVVGTGGRPFNGDATGQWRGRENIAYACTYTGNTPPGNFNAPAHLEHMQGQGQPPNNGGWVWN